MRLLNRFHWGHFKISILLTLVGIFGYLLFSPFQNPNSNGSKTTNDGPSLEEIFKPTVQIIRGSISQNSSLYSSMVGSGVPSDLVAKITEAMPKIFNLGHSLPGDEYQLEYFPPDSLVSFEYKTNGRDKYLVRPKADSLIALKVYKDAKRFLRGVNGNVKGTLWDTMVKMGEDPALIAKLADIFAWDIDFLTEVRNGDEFDFVVEGFEEEGNMAFYGDILVARYSLQGTEHYGILFQDPDGHRDYYDYYGKSLRKTLLKSPLNYRSVTSRFSRSRFHPILKIRRPHYGVDYSANVGTPVVAAGDGRVIFKGWDGGYGNTVAISHPQEFQTFYGHLSRFARGLVQGQWIEQGQVIGYVGSTGLSSGPHLDYRVKRSGNFIDPLGMKPPSEIPIPSKYMQDYIRVRDEALLTMQSITGDGKIYISSASSNNGRNLASIDKKSTFP